MAVSFCTALGMMARPGATCLEKTVVLVIFLMGNCINQTLQIKSGPGNGILESEDPLMF